MTTNALWPSDNMLSNLKDIIIFSSFPTLPWDWIKDAVVILTFDNSILLFYSKIYKCLDKIVVILFIYVWWNSIGINLRQTAITLYRLHEYILQYTIIICYTTPTMLFYWRGHIKRVLFYIYLGFMFVRTVDLTRVLIWLRLRRFTW